MTHDANDGKGKNKTRSANRRQKTVSQRQLSNHFWSISVLRLTTFVKPETAPPAPEEVTFRHACHDEGIGRLTDVSGAEGEEERHRSLSEKMWKTGKNVNQPPQWEANKGADVTSSSRSSVSINIFRSEMISAEFSTTLSTFPNEHGKSLHQCSRPRRSVCVSAPPCKWKAHSSSQQRR